MAKPAIHGFDFEHWAALARTDPQGFEAERAAVVEAAIRRAPRDRQRRLRGLQRRIDRSEERRVGKECRSRWSPYP